MRPEVAVRVVRAASDAALAAELVAGIGGVLLVSDDVRRADEAKRLQDDPYGGCHIIQQMGRNFGIQRPPRSKNRAVGGDAIRFIDVAQSAGHTADGGVAKIIEQRRDRFGGEDDVGVSEDADVARRLCHHPAHTRGFAGAFGRGDEGEEVGPAQQEVAGAVRAHVGIGNDLDIGMQRLDRFEVAQLGGERAFFIIGREQEAGAGAGELRVLHHRPCGHQVQGERKANVGVQKESEAKRGNDEIYCCHTSPSLRAERVEGLPLTQGRSFDKLSPNGELA